ncbi:MAG: 7-cyano-7-deazaguanine synthase [Thermodesulfobacteriota bacterium]
MTKAVALLSGGLDSTLAVKLMIEQGIEVHALNFTSAFCTCDAGSKHKGELGVGCKTAARRVAEEFGVPIKVLVKGLDYIDVVRNPKYGYGKGINPCVDCRIYMFTLAKKYMEEIGASFVITGEVLGQRPMSQRRDCFGSIEKDSGLEGLILRPLSAKHLDPTIPEKTGLVDREKLLSVTGRSRKPQMELAENLDVGDYPCPSGGCLLTDKIFSKKVRDLLDHNKDVNIKDLHTLKSGRHFRYEGAKIVVGRNDADNTKIKALAQPGDTFMEPVDFPGPVALVSGESPNGIRAFAGRLILRYANKSEGRGTIRAVTDGNETEFEVSEPVDDKTIEEFRVC